MKTNKRLTIFLISVAFSLVINISSAQSYQTNAIQVKSDFQWPEGKKMALSLTFDDARLSQVDKGLPLLDKYGVKATFYVSPSSMIRRLEGWKKAVNNGHDIGNHSLLHPCTGNFGWSRNKALEDYTLQEMYTELDSASKLIKKELGIHPVSFAFPCGQTFVGRGKMTKSYVPLISSMFETGRGWLDEGPNDPSFCDMSQLTGMELDGKSFDQIKTLIESAKSKGQWLVLAGHEMNEGGSQTSLLSTLEAICQYASDPANGIWIDNVHNIASYVKEKRGEMPFAETPVYKNPLFPTEQRIDDLLLTGLDLVKQIITLGKDANYELSYASLSAQVDKERLRQGVYYLSQDPLPRRVLNWSLPGHALSSLEEADAWIAQQLASWGYTPERDETQVRAFGRDFSKPLAHQYAAPSKDAPWYTAHNIMARKQGRDHPEQLIVILAHKDSQSWIASPGANDNAIGTCGALELARVLSGYQPKHSLLFIFCNEEHTPWTSVTAAHAIKTAGLDVLAVINLDGIGVKSPQQAGRLTNVTRYTTPEGERLADLMTRLNERCALGLEQTKYHSERPGDDDGSFINAGFPWAVLNIGSWPYGDPNYHIEGDSADKVDFENARLVVQLTLAAILHLDAYGRP